MNEKLPQKTDKQQQEMITVTNIIIIYYAIPSFLGS